MSRDTSVEASALRTELYRRMGPERRCEIAFELSAMTRKIAEENIRRRHPEYDAHAVRMALFRLLLGDELFRRAYPAAAVLAP